MITTARFFFSSPTSVWIIKSLHFSTLHFRPTYCFLWRSGWHTVGQNNQECKETSGIKCVSHVEKLELKFLHNKKKEILGYSRTVSTSMLSKPIIKCVTEPKIFIFWYAKILTQAFLHDSHIWFWRFLYILGCSGPRCAARYVLPYCTKMHFDKISFGGYWAPSCLLFINFLKQ